MTCKIMIIMAFTTYNTMSELFITNDVNEHFLIFHLDITQYLSRFFYFDHSFNDLLRARGDQSTNEILHQVVLTGYNQV
jgi:hypothetical protein